MPGPLHSTVQYQNGKVNEPVATFPLHFTYKRALCFFFFILPLNRERGAKSHPVLHDISRLSDKTLPSHSRFQAEKSCAVKQQPLPASPNPTRWGNRPSQRCWFEIKLPICWTGYDWLCKWKDDVWSESRSLLTKNMTDLIRVFISLDSQGHDWPDQSLLDSDKIKIQVTSLLALLLEPSSQLKRLRLVKI